MVADINRRGLYEWVVQRVSAVFIGVYSIYLFIYFLAHQPLSYSAWHALFIHVSMKIITVIVLLSLLWHAWIGLWTVLTDYVKRRLVRFLLETLIIILLLSYFIWCIETLWVSGS